ncbi:hypothetical protein AB1B06_25605, partial [Pseudomonas aeruginosa]|uniref:hypothetical protein n=1 Tax=Pseudomonas aeruginosa TaxID=287 RepID=UPI003456963A
CGGATKQKNKTQSPTKKNKATTDRGGKTKTAPNKKIKKKKKKNHPPPKKKKKIIKNPVTS